jgi:phosphoglycerate dehydrogenase-like enzyme
MSTGGARAHRPANPKLRWVMTTAAGGERRCAGQLDRAALDRIAFTTSAGVHGGPLAEFAVFGVLAGAKDLPRLIADQQGRHGRTAGRCASSMR